MRLTILILALLTGASAMAVETNYKPAPAPTGGYKSEADRVLNSDRSQELDRIVDMLLKGDKAEAEKAYEVYRQRYNPPPVGTYPGSENATPKRRAAPETASPRLLPPEAR